MTTGQGFGFTYEEEIDYSREDAEDDWPRWVCWQENNAERGREREGELGPVPLINGSHTLPFLFFLRFLMGLTTVEHRPRVLCAWIAGEGARKVRHRT